MKNQKVNFKIIAIVISIFIIIILGVILYKNKTKTKQEQNENQQETTEQERIGLIDMNNTENAKIENGIKQNTSQNILKDRNLNGIEITEIQLNAQEGISHFTATVKNNTSKDFAGGVAKINIYKQRWKYICRTRSIYSRNEDRSYKFNRCLNNS